MRRARRTAVVVAIVVTGAMSALPVGASATSARAAHASMVPSPRRTTGHCHRVRKPCSHATSSVSGTDGGLTVTFTSSESGSVVTFDITWSESAAYGAVGPEVLSFGDGTSQAFATPEYCLADPMAASGDRTVSYTYEATGSYIASVTVGANCTPDRLTLTLPVSIG